ncbi:hypothetical protein BLNAU_22063 [Blattamonas nauphoetae]|uniref:Uncharacterized protein n=1 Tax=Blattamonas nauphoetae TaxID=2049346 RepID=A0ABQ9WU51_9EUKA|nr:hypothetical protein BLNAU_22063 [Blattamonas nauphoetae]
MILEESGGSEVGENEGNDGGNEDVNNQPIDNIVLQKFGNDEVGGDCGENEGNGNNTDGEGNGNNTDGEGTGNNTDGEGTGNNTDGEGNGNDGASEDNKSSENAEVAAETNHPHSHLHESLNLIRYWGKKKTIGFTKTNGELHVCAVGSSQPLHSDVKQLYQQKFIPLCQMYVPMDYLNRLPVTLYGARELVPFEIKSLLVGDSTADTDISKQFSMRDHLRCGQLVTLDDLKVIFDQNIMREPVFTKFLTPLHSCRRSLSLLNMSDFQLLVSYVNGSSLIVADILQLCIKYLTRPDQLTPRDMAFLVNYLRDPKEYKNKIKQKLTSPDQMKRLTTQKYLDGLCHRASQTLIYFNQDITSFIGSLDGNPTLILTDLNEIHTISQTITSDTPITRVQAKVAPTLETTKQNIEDNLNIMETLLKNALNIVNLQFQLLVQVFVENNPPADITDEDRDLLLDWFRRNPLLSLWHRLELIPFFIDVSLIQEKKQFLIDRLSEDSSLEQCEIELLCSFLTIQTPLEEEETRHLYSLVDGIKIEEQSKETLLALICGKKTPKKETFHRLSNISNLDYKTKWCDAMNSLEKNQYKDLDRTFLRRCLVVHEPLNGSEQKDLLSVVESTTFSAKDKNTLHSLITGKPIFSQMRREAIVSNYLCHQDSDLDGSDKEHKINLVRTELARSDQEIAIECVRHTLHSAEQDLDLLFKILRGKEQMVIEEGGEEENVIGGGGEEEMVIEDGGEELMVIEKRNEELVDTMNKIRSRIVLTIRDVFRRLERSHQFSWKDLASLLCCPNGNRTHSLIAILALAENLTINSDKLQGETISISSATVQRTNHSEVNQFVNDPSKRHGTSRPQDMLRRYSQPPYDNSDRVSSTPTPVKHRTLFIPKEVVDKRSGKI